MNMKKKYRVKVIKGNWIGLRGWTYDAGPNSHGNLMVYSDSSANPYRICISADEVMYFN